MNSSKVLYFLKLLYKNTKGYEEELGKLISQAYNDDERVKELRLLQKNYDFHSESGNQLHEKVVNLLREYKYDNNDYFPEIEQLCVKVKTESNKTDKLFNSILPFEETIDVIAIDKINIYNILLKHTAACSIYLIALYNGINGIKSLPMICDNVRELNRLVNKFYLPAMLEIPKTNINWVIFKNFGGGKALFNSDCFYLKYISYEELKDAENSCENTERMGTHAWLNIDAYEKALNDVPYCGGSGNLLTVTPNNGLSLLGSEVVQTLRSPDKNELKRKLPSPLSCIQTLADEKIACISPDELVLSLNRWYVGSEIETLKHSGKCLFCGQPVKSKLFCSNHFSSE